jgi:hypothetical protein
MTISAAQPVPPAANTSEPSGRSPASGWIASVRDGLALMMIAGVASATVAYFPVGIYHGRLRDWPVVAMLHLGVALLPGVAGWFGAWLVTRPTGAAPEASPRWLRTAIRASASAGFGISCTFAVAPGLWELFGYDGIHRAVTLLLVLANGLVYLHLALLSRRLLSPLLALPCHLLAVLLPVLMLWVDLWRLAIGLETYGRLMLLTGVPVIGTGLPQTARYAGVLVGDTSASAGASAAQVLLLYAIAILAMLVLLELRRVLRGLVRDLPASALTITSPP